MILFKQGLFQGLGVRGGLFEPAQDSLGMEAFRAYQRRDARALGQLGERIDDLVLFDLFAIEEGAFIFVVGLTSAFAAVALLALRGFPVFDDGGLFGIGVVGAVGIGTEGAYLCQVFHWRACFWSDKTPEELNINNT